VHAVRQAKAMFAEMRERLELAREAWAEAREEGQGHVSAGLAALRAAAGRQAKELDQDEIKERLARIAGRDLGEAQEVIEGQGALRDIRGRLSAVLARETAAERSQAKAKQHELDDERERQRRAELERQRQRDRDLGWEL
jgi:hypothetical protein